MEIPAVSYRRADLMQDPVQLRLTRDPVQLRLMRDPVQLRRRWQAP
jgi:hypothetical protein